MSTKEIQEQIKSLTDTAQITAAMEMVAASKMKKAQDRAIKAIPYAEAIYDIVNKIGGTENYTSIYLKKPVEVKKIGIVVIGTSRGFVGSMITNLTVKALQLKNSLVNKYGQKVQFEGISIHKTGQKILANAGIKNDYHFAKYIENPSTTELTSIFNILVDLFSEGKVDEVHLIYTHFINTMVQQSISKKILPLSFEDISEEAQKQSTDSSQNNDFLYEPSISEVLDRLLPEYFQTQIFSGLLESIASENSARMVAMKNATENAKDMNKQLTLQYNRTRQAKITQQIIEVINGSN